MSFRHRQYDTKSNNYMIYVRY